MTAFYNEIDPDLAEWLRELIAAGHIAPGVVDERSIEDITPEELNGYTQCHFFAGIGVWSFALRAAGWPDDRPVWTGSCPCQPFSAAGQGAGFNDERHLWPTFHYLIRERKPAVVLGEQVASAAVDAWIDLVHADLEALGYAFGSVPFPSAGAGAWHIRDRNYWAAQRLADPQGQRRQGYRRPAPIKSQRGIDERRENRNAPVDWIECSDGYHRPVKPGTFPLVDESPARLVRVRGYGNAMHAGAATAWIEAVMGSIE